MAKEQGTSVNILAIEGSSVSLGCLSAVSEKSNGTVDILHPLELVRQIRKISQAELIATDVELSFIAHPEIQLSEIDSPKGLSRAVKEIGIVRSNTDFTFEFQIRAKYKSTKRASYPFQVSDSFISAYIV